MIKKAVDWHVVASGHVLTDWIPDSWRDMTESDKDEWLESHVCDMCEYWQARQIWEIIDDIARSLEEAYNAGVEEANE